MFMQEGYRGRFIRCDLITKVKAEERAPAGLPSKSSDAIVGSNLKSSPEKPRGGRRLSCILRTSGKEDG
jgi:hypothetical protein